MSGPVEVHVGREWSLFDWSRPLRAGRQGRVPGHRPLARRHRAPARDAHAARDEADLRRRRTASTSSSSSWPTSSSIPARAGAGRVRPAAAGMLFETAAAFGAHHIKVGNIPGTPCELEPAHRGVRRAVRRRGRAHDAKIAYEFMPFDVNVHTLEAALELVGGAGAPNGGLAIDTWHMAQARDRARGPAPDPARAARLGRAVRRPVREHGGPRRRDVNHRRLPGEGEFDIPGYVEVLPGARLSRGRGASRCSRRSCAACRSRRIFERAYETTRRAIPRRRRVRREERDDRQRARRPGDDRLIWIYTQMLRIREFEERVKRTFEEHPGRDPGAHAPGRRRRGVDRRLAGDAARRRPAAGDLPLPRLSARARHRPEGDDGRDLRPQRRPLRRLRRLDAPASTPSAASSAPRGSSARASRRRPAPPTRRRSASRARSCSASSATAPPSRARSAESLNVASLWKLPIVYVMENNSYNVVTRVEQEDANAAAGEPLAVKAKAFSMPGRDGRRRRPAGRPRRGRRGGRAGALGRRARRWSSRRSTG